MEIGDRSFSGMKLWNRLQNESYIETSSYSIDFLCMNAIEIYMTVLKLVFSFFNWSKSVLDLNTLSGILNLKPPWETKIKVKEIRRSRHQGKITAK